MAKKRFIFLASTKSRWESRPKLSKCEVIKETPKMLKLGDETEIIGGKMYYNQIHKENDRYFDDPIEAIEFLLVLQAESIKKAEIRLDNTHDDRELLEKLLKEMRKNDE